MLTCAGCLSRKARRQWTEGKATILHQGENVFYNPAQVIKHFIIRVVSPTIGQVDMVLTGRFAAAGYQQGSVRSCAALLCEAEAGRD